MSISQLGNIGVIDSFLKSLFSMTTFQEIHDWDIQAQTWIDTLMKKREELDHEKKTLIRKHDLLVAEYGQKNFLSKAFSSRSEEGKIKIEITGLDTQLSVTESYLDELAEKQDFSPNNPEELKALISELKTHKKELQLEKKAVAANMQQIRAEAKQRTLENMGSIFTSSTYARRNIRYQKDQLLRPHETEKMALDRQMLSIDLKLIWLGKIHE